MRKQFRLWLTENEGYNVLNEAGSFWRRTHMTPSVPTPPPMAKFAPPEPEEPHAVHSDANPKLKNIVEMLIKELGIGNQVSASPYLRHALYHTVGVMHPKIGTGGRVIFAPLAAISDAVIRNAMKDKELDPDNDETLKIASSPVTFINHLRSLWGGFRPGTEIEGATGHKADNDRWFINQDAQYRKARLGKYAQGYKSWHEEPKEAPNAATAAPSASGGAAPAPAKPNVVIGIMHALPDYTFRGADMTKLASAAQSIAQQRGVEPPTEAELKKFMKDKRLIGTIESVSPSAVQRKTHE